MSVRSSDVSTYLASFSLLDNPRLQTIILSLRHTGILYVDLERDTPYLRNSHDLIVLMKRWVFGHVLSVFPVSSVLPVLPILSLVPPAITSFRIGRYLLSVDIEQLRGTLSRLSRPLFACWACGAVCTTSVTAAVFVQSRHNYA